MNTTHQETQQKIYDSMFQLQADLETALKRIFEQAGNRIQPEKQEEVQQKIAQTKQVIERFKGKYAY